MGLKKSSPGHPRAQTGAGSTNLKLEEYEAVSIPGLLRYGRNANPTASRKLGGCRHAGPCATTIVSPLSRAQSAFVRDNQIGIERGSFTGVFRDGKGRRSATSSRQTSIRKADAGFASRPTSYVLDRTLSLGLEISGPNGAGQCLHRLPGTRFFHFGHYRRQVGFRLGLITRRGNVIESRPETIDPDSSLQSMRLR
jgi:hypothetical protein